PLAAAYAERQAVEREAAADACRAVRRFQGERHAGRYGPLLHLQFAVRDVSLRGRFDVLARECHARKFPRVEEPRFLQGAVEFRQPGVDGGRRKPGLDADDALAIHADPPAAFAEFAAEGRAILDDLEGDSCTAYVHALLCHGWICQEEHGKAHEASGHVRLQGSMRDMMPSWRSA